MTPERVVIGGAELWYGDSREIVPALAAQPAAVIADPPYGQALKTNVHRSGPHAKHYPPILGDDRPFDPAPWLQVADITLLWGAHKFSDRLPPGSWLVWDKRPDGMVRHQGDGEAALLMERCLPRRQRGGRPRRPIQRPMRIYRLLWDGWRVGAAGREDVRVGRPRVHPTQKPTALMRWCIQQARVPAGGIILDPWMGSGSTGLAALQLGHFFVGVEAERRYFDVACERIQALQDRVKEEGA